MINDINAELGAIKVRQEYLEWREAIEMQKIYFYYKDIVGYEGMKQLEKCFAYRQRHTGPNKITGACNP